MQQAAQQRKTKPNLFGTAALANPFNSGQIPHMHCNRRKRRFYWEKEGGVSKNMSWLYGANEALLPRASFYSVA